MNQHRDTRDRYTKSRTYISTHQNPSSYAKLTQPQYSNYHDGRVSIQTRIFLPQSQIIRTEQDPKNRKKTLHQITKILARRFQPYIQPELDTQSTQDGQHYRRASDRGTFPERRMESTTAK